MTGQDEGDYYIEAVHPKDGGRTSLIVKSRRSVVISQQGMGRAREIDVIVPSVVKNPVAIFRGVREMGGAKWHCYVGCPRFAYDAPTGQRIPPWPGMVYLVFVTDRSAVYISRWEPADPSESFLPAGYEDRFIERMR